MAKKIHIDEISPSEFTYERYEYDYGGRLDLDFRSSIDAKMMAREIKKRCIGWCDGSKLRIRPRSDMVAIMLEDDDFEKFWFHYPKVAFEMILDGTY
jgi:hypothetical protein